tara:strand:+ start:993 stop:1922 length:930 start_codon:yes stop_codon:yes gene_type:complete
MSAESDSDESLNSEDLNDLKNANENEVFEKPKKSVERNRKAEMQKKKKEIEKELEEEDEEVKKQEEEEDLIAWNKSFGVDKEGKPLKKEKKKITEITKNEITEITETKPKTKKPRSEKQLANDKRLADLARERARQRKEAKEKNLPLPKEAKSKAGRPKDPKIEVNNIYYIQDNEGNFMKVKNPKITKKDIEYHENDEKTKEQEKALGKALLRKKNGTADKRQNKRQPTEKQLEARKKFIENNKKRAEARRNKDKEEIHEVVHNTIVDVVKTPKTELVKKEKKKLHTLPILSEEKKKEIQLKKALSLFT